MAGNQQLTFKVSYQYWWATSARWRTGTQVRSTICHRPKSCSIGEWGHTGISDYHNQRLLTKSKSSNTSLIFSNGIYVTETSMFITSRWPVRFTAKKIPNSLTRWWMKGKRPIGEHSWRYNLERREISILISNETLNRETYQNCSRVVESERYFIFTSQQTLFTSPFSFQLDLMASILAWSKKEIKTNHLFSFIPSIFSTASTTIFSFFEGSSCSSSTLESCMLNSYNKGSTAFNKVNWVTDAET